MSANPYSLVINSTSNFATIGSGRILSALTNASVACWIKVVGTSGVNGAVFYGERAAVGNDLWKLGTGTSANDSLTFTHRDDAGTLDGPGAAVTLADGLWHHIVLTKAGVAYNIYHNGVSVTSGNLTGTDTLTDASTVSTIGNDFADQAASNFNGNIDEVALFNVALSDVQVSNLYSAASVPQVGLVSLFHCDAGTGTTLADSFGSNGGTIPSTTMWSAGGPKLGGLSVLNRGLRPHPFSPGIAR